MEAARAEDAAIGNDEDRADHSAGLGVTVTWLIAFTYAYNCWDWDTWEVQAHIIKPATEHCRRRYADLPHVRGVPGAVGLAEVFVSRAPTRPCAPTRRKDDPPIKIIDGSSQIRRMYHSVSAEAKVVLESQMV